MSQAQLAVLIFGLVYAFIILEPVPRVVVAVAGAALVVLLGVLDQETAIQAIDFNTIGLLIGMMIVVAVLKRTGFFEYLGVLTARLAGGQPGRLIVYFSVMTAIASAFLDNVTTILLTAPVSLSVARSLGLNPVPLVVPQILASNIGGTATLIGDPPNIMIGSAAGLGFVDFLAALTPLVFGVIFPAALLALYFTFRRELAAGGRRGFAREVGGEGEVAAAGSPRGGVEPVGAAPGAAEPGQVELQTADPAAAIRDPRLLRRALTVVALILAGFGAHQYLHIESATVALAGAALILLVSRLEVEAIFNDVEWSTIFFFAGLFVLVGALEHTGVIRALAQLVLAGTGGNQLWTLLLILWGSALASAFIDNIPFTATMIPLILDIQRATGADVTPYWWALALGACLGGNGTLIGASANVVAADLLREAGHAVSYVRFLKVGFPIMLLTIVLATVYLLVSVR